MSIVKPRRVSVAAVMLFAAFWLGGCAGKKEAPADIQAQAFAAVVAELQAVVTDPDRAAQAVTLINELEANFEKGAADMSRHKANLSAINADYDATRQDFKDEFASLNAIMSSNRKNVGRIRGRLVELLTAEEWATIEKARSRALESAFKAIAST